MIDDFQVPHDYEYGYDSDCGKILKLNFIKKIINKMYKFFFLKLKLSLKLDTKEDQSSYAGAKNVSNFVILVMIL